MRIAAIYNVWDGVELLNSSINCLSEHVDLIIIVYQTISNWGGKYDPIPDMNLSENDKIIMQIYHPEIGNGFLNERNKRNIGLDIAKKNNCTHFIHLDVDEMYMDFGMAKKLYMESGKKGSVCSIYTYFKKPYLRFESPDNYFVPFIHELKSDTVAGTGKYPFYVDPTRKINEQEVVMLPVFMHHFSWVRKNIERKYRNSSAKNNFKNGSILESYYNENCKPGFYVNDFEKKLIEVPDYFNIEEII